MRIGDNEIEALNRDGFLLMAGAFSQQRVQSLRDGVSRMIQRGQSGACELRWIDEAAGLPERTSHMMHPDKYDSAWGQWLAEDVIDDMEALLGGPARHSLFGMLASGGGRDYRMAWHRDIGKPGASDEEAYLRRFHGHSIQFNAPVLTADSFLHVVPGSHLRASTEQEITAASTGIDGNIAGGIVVRLEPGDILYYNANLWHRGWNPDGLQRWTMHAAYWKAEYPVMTHEQGQQQALQTPGHLQSMPAQSRLLLQRYIDACDDNPKSLQEL
jgi:hypothetical protein